MMNDEPSVPEHPQNRYSSSESSGNYRRDSSELVVHKGMRPSRVFEWSIDDDRSVPEHHQNAYVPSDGSSNYHRDSSELVVHKGMRPSRVFEWSIDRRSIIVDDRSVPEHHQNAYVPSDGSGNYRMDSSELVVHKGMRPSNPFEWRTTEGRLSMLEACRVPSEPILTFNLLW